jgi:hypothetical protein
MNAAQQLTEAISHRDAARKAHDSIIKWGNAKRDAAEELEFWMGKVAMLNVMAA